MTRRHHCGPTLGLIVLFVGLAIGAGSMYVYATALKPMPVAKGPPDVVCWEMPQADLKGWKRIPEVERETIAYRASLGKVNKREETSLKCREYKSGDVGEFLAREWWYKEKRK